MRLAMPTVAYNAQFPALVDHSAVDASCAQVASLTSLCTSIPASVTFAHVPACLTLAAIRGNRGLSFTLGAVEL